VARRERPAVAVLHQREWLAVLVEMDARGSRLVDVVANDDRPVPDRHIFEAVKGVQCRRDVPYLAEIPYGLLLKGSSYSAELRAVDLRGIRHKGDLGD
jgi:hypothetical protein